MRCESREEYYRHYRDQRVARDHINIFHAPFPVKERRKAPVRYHPQDHRDDYRQGFSQEVAVRPVLVYDERLERRRRREERQQRER